MVVKVSNDLYRELMKIKESGDVDMQDYQAVFKYAKERGLNHAARAIRGNPRRYLMCINEGMEASS
jgi:hypothetical protein